MFVRLLMTFLLLCAETVTAASLKKSTRPKLDDRCNLEKPPKSDSVRAGTPVERWYFNQRKLECLYFKHYPSGQDNYFRSRTECETGCNAGNKHIMGEEGCPFAPRVCYISLHYPSSCSAFDGSLGPGMGIYIRVCSVGPFAEATKFDTKNYAKSMYIDALPGCIGGFKASDCSDLECPEKTVCQKGLDGGAECCAPDIVGIT